MPMTLALGSDYNMIVNARLNVHQFEGDFSFSRDIW
jgi:hypothetical protein